MARMRMERVTIRDIPLEKPSFLPMPKEPREPPAQKLSERTWTIVRIAGAATILVGLGIASNVLSPGLTGSVIAAAQSVDVGLVAGVLGLALVVTIALSAVVSHDD